MRDWKIHLAFSTWQLALLTTLYLEERGLAVALFLVGLAWLAWPLIRPVRK